MILGAAYTLWMYKRVIYGAVANEPVARSADINRREFLDARGRRVLVLWMGVWPQPSST
jgi:NADH-quinone oxidoreductase subunit M